MIASLTVGHCSACKRWNEVLDIGNGKILFSHDNKDGTPCPNTGHEPETIGTIAILYNGAQPEHDPSQPAWMLADPPRP